MRSKKMFTILVLGLMVSLAQVGKSAPMGTAVTYQGRLMDANSAADGLYGFEFKLYDDDATGGIQQGSTVTIDNVDVIDGYFTVELDFGDGVFASDARWLEIGIRSDSSSPFTTLNPRQKVTPSPYAIYAQTAGSGGGDNLGNHTATQNINLNGNYLSGDGGNDGVYVANDGKVGIGTSAPGAKLEIIQNIWTNILKVGLLTSPNRLILSSGHMWASISGGTTNRNDIAIEHSTGNVGIGTGSPGAKLEVDGDLKVTGAYKGNISSSSGSDGAPFPRPAYDSGWVAVAQNSFLSLTHNIGGNLDNYVVDLQLESDPLFLPYGVNNFGHGLYNNSSGDMGAAYLDLTTTSIKVYRATADLTAAKVRIRIWVYN